MFSFTKFIKKGFFPSVRADDDDDEEVVNPRLAIIVSCSFFSKSAALITVVINQLIYCGYVQLFTFLETIFEFSN